MAHKKAHKSKDAAEYAKVEKRDHKDMKAKGNFDIKSKGKNLASTKSPVKKY
jgi:hypothetical protein